MLNFLTEMPNFRTFRMLWDKQEGRSGVKVMGGWVVERHPWLRAGIIIIVIITVIVVYTPPPDYQLKCISIGKAGERTWYMFAVLCMVTANAMR